MDWFSLGQGGAWSRPGGFSEQHPVRRQQRGADLPFLPGEGGRQDLFTDTGLTGSFWKGRGAGSQAPASRPAGALVTFEAGVGEAGNLVFKAWYPFLLFLGKQYPQYSGALLTPLPALSPSSESGTCLPPWDDSDRVTEGRMSPRPATVSHAWDSSSPRGQCETL